MSGGLIVLVVLGGACRGAESPSSITQPITSGVADSGHEYAGLLLVGASGGPTGTAKTICTASVVGQKTLLTAAHCCRPAENTLFQLNGRIHQVTRVTPHPSWNSAVSRYLNDIGLAVLGAPLPVGPVEAGTAQPSQGMKVTLVGFGRTATDVKDEGQKRTATNSIASVGGGYFTVTGTGSGVGNTCEGDSGGPVLATVGGKQVAIGVVSAAEATCGVKSYHVTVSAHLDWLVKTAAGDFFRPGITADGRFVPTDSGASEARGGDGLPPGSDFGQEDGGGMGRRPTEGCSAGGELPGSSIVLGLLFGLVLGARRLRTAAGRQRGRREP